MLYLVKLICYSVILSSVKLEFSACITLTQEENNIIASKPMRLVCDIGTIITTAVTVRSPDNIPVVSCTPTIIFPPAVAKCTSSGVYTGSINETTNTVIVTTNTLPGDVNGTWSCTHGSSVATIPFPNPIPCLVSESFVLSPSSLAANVTSDTTAFSLIATFSCFNVDVSFKWILKAGTSHEFTSSSVSKDSSSCTDSGTCTGVNAYTQTISSDSLFQFATAQSLKGGYELSAEAHYSSGIIALKSHSIGYFEFSGHASTQKPTTQPLPDQKCFLGIHYPLSVCVIIMIVGIIVVLIIVASIFYWCISCRKDSKNSSKPDQKHIYNDLRNVPEESENRGDEGISPQNGTESNLNSNDEFTPEQNHMHVDSNSRNIPGESENRGDERISPQNGTESNLNSNDEFTPERNHMHVDSNSRNIPEESENGGDEGISLQNGTESNLNSNNKTTKSAHKSESPSDYQSQNNPDKSVCNENSNRVEDDTSNFDAAKDAVTQV